MYSPVRLKIKNIVSHVDSEYEFKNGKAVIIVGLNHDNPSQRGNGSGKSALIESLALAFTGNSIRDVKTKELINRQAKEGEVELELFNSKFQKTLKISRKIYAGTKSQECRVWIENEEVRLSDVNSYNKFIFDEIGLTKEDFFNFYLLVEANYSPFLRVGDAKKKEIINRFSGADSIDQLLPLVKADLDLFTPEFDRINKEISQEQGKIAAYDESIERLTVEEREWEEKKAVEINSLKNKVIDSQTLIENYRNENANRLKKARELKEELIAKQYSTQLQELEKEKAQHLDAKSKLEQKIRELTSAVSKVKDEEEFKKRIKTITDRETHLIKLNKENAEIKAEYEEFKSEVEVQLQDVIECPQCSHHFSFKNAEFNEQAAKESLREVEQQIEILDAEIKSNKQEIDSGLFNQKQQVNQDILNKQNEIRNKINENNENVAKHNSSILAIDQKSQEIVKQIKIEKDLIANEVENISKNRKLVGGLLQLINTYQNSINEIESRNISKEKKAVYDNKIVSEAKISELTQEFDTLTEDRKRIAQWEVNFKNFKSFVANQSIKNIEDYTNIFLRQMGSDLGIFLDGFTTLASGKLKEQISIDVLRGGFNEGSYGAFSGGERGRIDICVILAIQQLINLNCKSGGLDLLICDEILDQIDTLGLESIINSLQNVNRTIMIVSQNEINALKDCTLLIEKRNKISTFTQI